MLSCQNLKPVTLTVSLVVVATLCLGSVTGQESKRPRTLADGANEQRTRILDELLKSPSIATRFENVKDAPLTITDSSSKEIGKQDYHTLVDLMTSLERVASFPQVKLFNNTGKRVTGFTLLLRNVQTKNLHAMKRSGIDVKPYSEHLVPSEQWVLASKQPDARSKWESDKMWQLAGANDLLVVVGEVVFEDGSTWRIPDASGPSQGSLAFLSPPMSVKARLQLASHVRLKPGLPFECVCYCGVDHHPDGSSTCIANCGSCVAYNDCVTCVNNCCKAAAKIEQPPQN